MNKQLTKQQRAALKWMSENYAFYDGMVARYGQQRRMLIRMEDIGLVAFIGYGPMDGGPEDREYPVYAITAAGRKRLEECNK